MALKEMVILWLLHLQVQVRVELRELNNIQNH